METPLLRMAGPVIGGREFNGHLAVAVDLSAANSMLSPPDGPDRRVSHD